MYSILLQVSSGVTDSTGTHLFYGSSIPDWAMGVGGIATCLTLFFLWRSGLGQQKSIDAISASLGELTTHSRELAVRNQLQNELNGVMTEQLNLMREMHLTNQVGADTQQHILQLEKEKHRIALAPAFYFTGPTGDANARRLSIKATNAGNRSATVNSVEVRNGTQHFGLTSQQFPLEVGAGESFTITGVWNAISFERLAFSLAIRYSDVLHNEYEVIVSNSPNGLIPKEPVLTTPSSDAGVM